LRHETLLGKNQRMALQLKNLIRLTPTDRSSIQAQADALRKNGGLPPRVGGEQGALGLN